MQPDRHAVLVVYESMFGNTEAVAQCIAEALHRHGVDATVVDARSAPKRLGPEVGLLLVGAPTHAFGMSRPSTRAAARATRVRPATLNTGSGNGSTSSSGLTNRCPQRASTRASESRFWSVRPRTR